MANVEIFQWGTQTMAWAGDQGCSCSGQKTALQSGSKFEER